MNLAFNFPSPIQTEAYSSYLSKKRANSWNYLASGIVAFMIFSSICSLIMVFQAFNQRIINLNLSQAILGFSCAGSTTVIYLILKWKKKIEAFHPVVSTISSLSIIIASYEISLLYKKDLDRDDYWMSKNIVIYYRAIPILVLTLYYQALRYKIVVFTTTIIYILVRDTPLALLGYNIVYGVLLCCLLTFLFLKAETKRKMKFQEKLFSESNENLKKTLLDGLPEGIMILNKHKKLVYQNQAMKVLFNAKPDEEGIPQKLQDLNLRHIIKKVQKHGEQIQNNIYSSHNNSPLRVHFPTDSPERSPCNFSDTIKGYLDKSSPTLNKLIRPKMSKIDLSVPSIYLDDLKQRRKLSRHQSDRDSEDLKFGKDNSIFDSSTPKLGPIGHNKMMPNPKDLQENYFKLKFENDLFRGYASNPVKINNYTVFNLYGNLYASAEQKEKDLYSESEYIALEIKYQEISINHETYVFLMISDISSREKLANLEESNRYKNLMFSSISHEFRTPINGVLGLLQATVKELQDQNMVQNLIKPALDSTCLLMYLIDDMLDYSKVLVDRLILSLDKFSVSDCMEEVINLAKVQANQKKLYMRLRVSEDCPKTIKADRRRVQQILMNLLSNAIKFTNRGGIEIIVEAVHYNTPSIKISVIDTGIGLRTADSNRLTLNMNDTHATRRLSNSSPGAGLGLMISHSLALALGPPDDIARDVAGITVESQYGKGSVFEFVVYNHDVVCTLEEEINTFPTMPEEHSPESRRSTTLIKTTSQPKSSHLTLAFAKSTTTSLSPARSLIQFNRKALIGGCTCPKVLIVDDSIYNILVLQTLLSSWNVKCDSANDGKEACEKVVEEHEKRKNCCKGYKLIFMDYNMPIMDGYEATCELTRKIEANEISFVPIVGCSAFFDKSYRDKSLSAGMSDFITKPVAPKVLEEILKRYELLIENKELVK